VRQQVSCLRSQVMLSDRVTPDLLSSLLVKLVDSGGTDKAVLATPLISTFGGKEDD
jgi:hypothetical protein